MQLNLFDESGRDNPDLARRRHPTGRKEQHADCVICGRDHRWYESMLWQVADDRRDLWRLVCRRCRKPYRLVVAAHRLSVPDALRLIRVRECECCGRSIPHRFNRPDVVVDHDHNCCESSEGSCGRCVRGFVCRPCNIALGWFDRPDRAKFDAYLRSRPILDFEK